MYNLNFIISLILLTLVFLMGVLLHKRHSMFFSFFFVIGSDSFRVDLLPHHSIEALASILKLEVPLKLRMNHLVPAACQIDRPYMS